MPKAKANGAPVASIRAPQGGRAQLCLGEGEKNFTHFGGAMVLEF